MNKLTRELLEYIEKLCVSYLREDKINKLDTDEKFTNELYLISSVGVILVLSDFSTYVNTTTLEISEVVNNDGRPYTSGYILYENFKVHIMTDPKMNFIDHRFWITHDTDLLYTKDSYKMPERFEVLFF